MASLRMAGALSSRADNGGVPIYFVADFEDGVAWRLWNKRMLPLGSYSVNGVNASLGALIEVPCGTSGVVARVALSFVSSAQALSNLAAQAPPGTTLESATVAATNAWTKALRVVTVVDAAANGRFFFFCSVVCCCCLIAVDAARCG